MAETNTTNNRFVEPTDKDFENGPWLDAHSDWDANKETKLVSARNPYEAVNANYCSRENMGRTGYVDAVPLAVRVVGALFQARAAAETPTLQLVGVYLGVTDISLPNRKKDMGPKLEDMSSTTIERHKVPRR